MTDTFVLTGRILDKAKQPVKRAHLKLKGSIKVVRDGTTNELYAPTPRITTDDDGYLCVALDANQTPSDTPGVPLVVGVQYRFSAVLSSLLDPLVFSDAQATAGALDLADVEPENPTPDTTWTTALADIDARLDDLEAGGGGGGAVDSVNTQTGVVVLDAADVGADPSGTAAGLLTAHAGASDPHPQYLTPAEGAAAYDALGAATSAQTAAIGAAATDATTKANAAQTAATAAAATDATSKVATETSRATAAEALKAPLASPTFTGTVSGVTKSMVGLSAVDNTSDANKPVSTAQAAADALALAKASNLSDLASATTARTNLGLGTAATADTGTTSGKVPLLSTGGVLPIARLATGTPDGTKFVRDDGTLAVPAGGGGGAVSSVAGKTGAIQLTPADLVGVPGLWRVAWMGDSITNNGASVATNGLPDRNGYGAAIFGGTGIHGWALLASKGLFSYGGVYATGGYTAAQIRATHLPQVLAASPAPDACVVLATANKGTSFAQDIADLTAIYTSLQAAGILPVLCTSLDGNDPVLSNNVRTSWIRRYARMNNLPLVDYYASNVDPTTGGIVAAYTADGTHPNTVGAKVMGDLVAATLLQYLTLHGAPDLPMSDTSMTDLIHTHPLMTTATSGVPTDWTLSSGTAGQVTNPVGPAGVVGNVLTITRNTSDVQVRSASSVTLVAGHVYQFTFKVRATVTSGDWTIRLQNATSGVILWGFSQIGVSTNSDFSTVTVEMTCPSGLPTYDHRMLLIANGAGTVLELAQFGWNDLTANGIV